MASQKQEKDKKELALLRKAVEEAEQNTGRKQIESKEIGNIINIVETFLRVKRLVCYGGTAINNILPNRDKFYDPETEIPDFDFYSPNALLDTKALAEKFVLQGYEDVEAKSAIHKGTYKVYVNFIPVADITSIDPLLYKALKKESLKVNGIHYAPPNFLKMAMYLELSRPAGDVSRWEKVLKRLNVLNKNYPIVNSIECSKVKFQRKFETETSKSSLVFTTIRDILVNQEVVFFGGYAFSLYRKYIMPKNKRPKNDVPDFDVLSDDPLTTATVVKEKMSEGGFKNVTVTKKDGVGEIIPTHYEIRVDDETICFIYQTNACHSFNTIKINGVDTHVATIDTILSFYLAFIYSDKPYYDKERLLCMAKYIFEVQQRNKTRQTGLVKRFTTQCYGEQVTLRDMRYYKTEKYKLLKKNKNCNEYNELFLRYFPKLKSVQKKDKTTEKATKNATKNATKKATKKATKSSKTRRISKK